MYHPTPRIHQVRPRLGQDSRPDERFAAIRRLVVFRNDGLTNVVLTLPAIRALRRGYPEAWITLVVDREQVPFARMLEDPDEVVHDPGTTGDMVAWLRSTRPDLIVCASGDSRAPWASWKAGVPHRIGSGFRLYAPVLNRRVDEPRRPGERHELEHAMDFARRAGADASEAVFPIRLPAHAWESTANWLDMKRLDGPLVVLHPGGDGDRPCWPASRFFELATLLEAEGIRVVFCLGYHDDDVAAALAGEHPSVRRLPRFLGDPVSLSCLLARCAVVVGSGTPPVHLAAALGTPTLALHPPWPSCGPDRWGPYSRNGWSLVADLPESASWSARKCRREGDALLAGLAPTVVLRAVRDLLEGRPPGSDQS